MNRTHNPHSRDHLAEWTSRIVDELLGQSDNLDDSAHAQDAVHEADVDENDARIVAEALLEWDVPPMTESALEELLGALRPLVPASLDEFRFASAGGVHRSFWCDAKHTVQRVPLTYWVTSGVSYMAALFFAAAGGIHAYSALFLVGPIPALLGVREVFRGREQGMAELELTCTRSGTQVLFSKMSLLALFSLGMNTVLSLLASELFGLEMWRAIACGLAPWAALSGTGLWIATRTRSGPVIVALLVSWLGGGGALIATSWLGKWLLSLSPLAYAGLALIGLALVCFFAVALHGSKGVEWIVDGDR